MNSTTASPVKFNGEFWQDQLDDVIAYVRAMSSEELQQSLMDAGIITKSGRLAKPYRD